MKIYSNTSFLLTFISAVFFGVHCQNTEPTNNESAWISLFDGNSFNGWKMYGSNSDSISAKWIIKDGVIMASKEGDGPGINTGFDESLITKQQFKNFELQLEFQISEGGNSGVMYFVQEDSSLPMDYYSGLEYQILDDHHFENQVRDFQYTASVFGLLPSTDTELMPTGSWNSLRIIVNEEIIQHWLNGKQVLEFDRSSATYKEVYEKSQWTDFPQWGTADEGAISLQDHGDFVAFRTIRIREL